MPLSRAYKYIVQARCSLSYYPKFRMLRAETARMLEDWIYEDILCWWGSLCEIVTDNGPAFLIAMEYFSKCYHLNHIWLSGYNSGANGTVECSHFDVHQSLFKVVNGDQKQWSLVYSVFWAERVTPHKHMGCPPYFAITGAHPILPFDIAEVTYLQPLPTSMMSSTNLISCHTIALQKCPANVNTLYSKVYQAQLKVARRFEQQHLCTSKTSTSSATALSSCATPRSRSP
jgi:hypothetical protein